MSLNSLYNIFPKLTEIVYFILQILQTSINEILVVFLNKEAKYLVYTNVMVTPYFDQLQSLRSCRSEFWFNLHTNTCVNISKDIISVKNISFFFFFVLFYFTYFWENFCFVSVLECQGRAVGDLFCLDLKKKQNKKRGFPFGIKLKKKKQLAEKEEKRDFFLTDKKNNSLKQMNK